MKRKLPLFVMVGVAGVLVPVLAVLAQSSSSRPAACCSSASCTACKSPAPSSADGKIIDELIAILKETKSEETFIVTAMALGRMGPEAKRALPQLLRGAERLELFEDLFDSGAEAVGRQVAQHVAEAIMMLAETNKDGRPAGYACPPSPGSYGGGTYGPPAMPGTWNQPQPAVVPSIVPPCPTGAATCPVTPSPVVPGTALSPVDVPTPSAPAPAPSPAVKKVPPKKGKAPAPVPSSYYSPGY